MIHEGLVGGCSADKEDAAESSLSLNVGSLPDGKM